MRLLICGDRNWDDKNLIRIAIKELQQLHTIECIIQGEARGADTQGKEVAEEMNIPILSFKPDWNKLGRAAGIIRNKEMLIDGKPDYVLAFHDDIKNSKGTGNMIKITQKAGVLFTVWSH